MLYLFTTIAKLESLLKCQFVTKTIPNMHSSKHKRYFISHGHTALLNAELTAKQISLYRTVFSQRNTTTPHFECFTLETFARMVPMFAVDGILHLMEQNVPNQQLLKELSMSEIPKSTLIITALLKVTATTFPKVTYVWAFG